MSDFSDRLPAEPPERAVKDHRRWHGPWPVVECFRCFCSYRTCRSKVAHHTRESVDVVVDEINARESYVEPVMRYPCIWGAHWHVGHAKKRKDLRRLVRAERRWRLTLTSPLNPTPEGQETT